MRDVYGLDDDIVDRLVVRYDEYTSTGTKKIKRVKAGEYEGALLDVSMMDKDGVLRLLTLDDVKLYVEIEAGTSYQADVTCDSAFMLQSTREIGENIRAKFHWVPMDTPITLFMDNAGGHGTDEAKNEYIRILHEEFNVSVEWQVPNSPETNLLDLGGWVTIQSLVEWLHRQRLMNADVLAGTVLEAWDAFDAKKLTKISLRWEKVLRLIIKGGGTNDFVEKERGLTKPLFEPLELPAVAADCESSDGDDELEPNELVAI
jgi:hypothetical protein